MNNSPKQIQMFNDTSISIYLPNCPMKDTIVYEQNVVQPTLAVCGYYAAQKLVKGNSSHSKTYYYRPMFILWKENNPLKTLKSAAFFYADLPINNVQLDASVRFRP